MLLRPGTGATVSLASTATAGTLLAALHGLEDSHK